MQKDPRAQFPPTVTRAPSHTGGQQQNSVLCFRTASLHSSALGFGKLVVRCNSGSSLAAGMALVAIRAVIHIAAYTLMTRICLRLPVAAYARENRVVRRIRVASGANSSGISVVHWKPGVV